ncbi:MAG: hypothetical protein ACFFCS_06705 [Candidatus Hodarchaeota archaeon]
MANGRKKNNRNAISAWLGGTSWLLSIIGIILVVSSAAAMEDQHTYHESLLFPFLLAYGIVTMIMAIAGIAFGSRVGPGKGNGILASIFALCFAVGLLAGILLGPFISPGEWDVFDRGWWWY